MRIRSTWRRSPTAARIRGGRSVRSSIRRSRAIGASAATARPATSATENGAISTAQIAGVELRDLEQVADEVGHRLDDPTAPLEELADHRRVVDPVAEDEVEIAAQPGQRAIAGRGRRSTRSAPAPVSWARNASSSALAVELTGDQGERDRGVAGERRRQAMGEGQDPILVVHLEAEGHPAGRRDGERGEPRVGRTVRSRPPRPAVRSGRPRPGRRRRWPVRRPPARPGSAVRWRRARPRARERRSGRPARRPSRRTRPPGDPDPRTGRRPGAHRRSQPGGRGRRPGGVQGRPRRPGCRGRGRAAPPPRGRADPPPGGASPGARHSAAEHRRRASGPGAGRSTTAVRPCRSSSMGRCIREIPRPAEAMGRKYRTTPDGRCGRRRGASRPGREPRTGPGASDRPAGSRARSPSRARSREPAGPVGRGCAGRRR